MTKLEEIARAIHDSFYNDEVSGVWMSGKCPLESVTIDGDVDMMEAARAVLSTLKTPTPGMIEAACHDAVWDNLENRLSGDISKRIYRAMIDAAEGG